MVYTHIHFNDAAAALITQVKLVALRNWSPVLSSKHIYIDKPVTVAPFSIKY